MNIQEIINNSEPYRSLSEEAKAEILTINQDYPAIEISGMPAIRITQNTLREFYPGWGEAK